MNKETFLSRLEQLLYDIPREEREEAMDYYRSYFEEAGEENEASVLEELDSPQEIAASIKADLKGPDSKAGRLKNPPQVRGMQKETHDSGEKTGYGFSEAGAHYRRYDEPRQSAQDQEFHGSSRAYGQYEKQTEKKKSGINLDKQAKLILLVIVAFFAFPVWGSLASVALGIIGIVIGAVVALGAFAAGGVIGGLVCSVVGIVNLCMLSVIKGLLALGTGLLLIAAGGICTVLMILICGRLIPKTVRQIISLLRRLLDWGRRVA